MQISREMLYYKGMSGNNEGFDNRASGAYIFRPNGEEAYSLAVTTTNQYDGRILIHIFSIMYSSSYVHDYSL